MGYSHLSLKQEMVFQPENALFHFMVLFYLVISVEDIYLKENRERENPSLHPSPVKFHLPVASFLVITYNVFCNPQLAYLGRDFVLSSTDRAVSGFAVHTQALCLMWRGLKIISCFADVTLVIIAAKEY